jgi:hypothetical protein
MPMLVLTSEDFSRADLSNGSWDPGVLEFLEFLVSVEVGRASDGPGDNRTRCKCT